MCITQYVRAVDLCVCVVWLAACRRNQFPMKILIAPKCVRVCVCLWLCLFITICILRTRDMRIFIHNIHRYHLANRLLPSTNTSTNSGHLSRITAHCRSQVLLLAPALCLWSPVEPATLHGKGACARARRVCCNLSRFPSDRITTTSLSRTLDCTHCTLAPSAQQTT